MAAARETPSSSPGSALAYLECTACGATHDAEHLHGLCPACGGILYAHYDLKAGFTRRDLGRRPRSLWRYWELLPLRDPASVVSLGEVMTPLVKLARRAGEPEITVKDEAMLPTGSFKARGAAVGVSRLKELGGTELVMPTNGNAGAAWAAYAARAGMMAHVVMPRDAPQVTREECELAGADVRIVDGLIGDAGKVSAGLASEHGWFDASTFKEPYRLEGKKTMGFEIAEQLRWKLPDCVVYPTGGGVGLLGMWKAWAELRELGLVERLPRLVAAQSAGCAPVVAAFQAGATATQAWPDAATQAFGINVPNPLAGPLMLQALRESGGCAIAVPEAEIAAERRRAYREEGLHLCPEGACGLAAIRALAGSGWLAASAQVLLLNTGSGLKYPPPPT